MDSESAVFQRGSSAEHAIEAPHPSNLEKQSIYSETTNASLADEKAADKSRYVGDIREPPIPEEDEFAQDVFSAGAEGKDDHIEFRTMGWVQAGFVCLAEVSGVSIVGRFESYSAGSSCSRPLRSVFSPFLPSFKGWDLSVV